MGRLQDIVRLCGLFHLLFMLGKKEKKNLKKSFFALIDLGMVSVYHPGKFHFVDISERTLWISSFCFLALP